MPEDILTSLDTAFAKAAREPQQERPLAPVVPFLGDAHAADVDTEVSVPRSLRDRWPWLEIYFVVQFAWGALLFLPDAQIYRPAIRALPYVSSLGLLAVYLPAPLRGRYPRGAGWLLAAIALLAANLLRPTSHTYAGVAQLVFQASIAAPAFWAGKAVRSPQSLHRLLVLTFALNCVSAALGLLQVYFPDNLMPPQFNSLGSHLNEYYVESLTYVGRDGRAIVRPPGLSDMPGGAALAGAFTAVLGLGLTLRAKNAVQVAGLLLAAMVGIAVIYLTQVRSVLLMLIGSVAVLSVVAFRQRRAAAATWIVAAGGALGVAAFFWASTVGGESVEQRFLDIRDQGAFETYRQNRGHFLASTVGELLDEFPLGAGVGRWGMMNTYFAESSDAASAPIHVEIQLTGWLLDGGIPLWIFYGGALMLSLLAAWRMTRIRDPDTAHAALLTLILQVMITGLALAGPVFNTQLGMVFWTFASVLSATTAHVDRRSMDGDPV